MCVWAEGLGWQGKCLACCWCVGVRVCVGVGVAACADVQVPSLAVAGWPALRVAGCVTQTHLGQKVCGQWVTWNICLTRRSTAHLATSHYLGDGTSLCRAHRLLCVVCLSRWYWCRVRVCPCVTWHLHSCQSLQWAQATCAPHQPFCRCSRQHPCSFGHMWCTRCPAPPTGATWTWRKECPSGPAGIEPA